MKKVFYIFAATLFVFSLVLISCEKDQKYVKGQYRYENGELIDLDSTNMPTVHTKVVENVTGNSAVCGGEVTNSGAKPVSARGVCWSTSQIPTINDNHTTNGEGVGNFPSYVTGLTIGTTYYVRAYATNAVGTAYGEERSFTTTMVEIPTVTTNSVSNITSTTAICGGNVTSTGGASVTARGVCWSTSQNPTINNNHTTNGSGTGSFTSSLTGLTASTTYYVRAYATNSSGTSYGEQKSFKTSSSGETYGQPCPGAATVTDYDGNSYPTVKIGNQCWMAKNLRTTHYANGASISLGSSTSTTTAYYYYPNGSSSTVPTYGLLYNWKAVMNNSSSSDANPSGVQGICPNGWHVPSHAEWTQLTTYVSNQSQFFCDNNNTSIAKALAGEIGWNSSTNTCAIGNNPSTNNSSGFTALPAGSAHSGYPSIDCDYFGKCAYFWSAEAYLNDVIYVEDQAYMRRLDNDKAEVVDSYLTFKSRGLSVRCLRN